jgi:hypothetical protein
VISLLLPHQIFVFGSNLAGEHLGGAARQAANDFGAEWGVGEGLTGQCYAFPTLDENFKTRTDSQLQASVERFFETARAQYAKEFLLTKVGCGIAGYDEPYIQSKFKNAPPNVVLPEDWR